MKWSGCASYRKNSTHSLGFHSASGSILEKRSSSGSYGCSRGRNAETSRPPSADCGKPASAARDHPANFGAQVFGITLSENQAEFARARFREAGVADGCKVEVCDYRELDPPQEFDKIVSVGMFDHVGKKALPEYFRHAWSVLRPGGVMLNHGIASSCSDCRRGPSFITKYVFPDGELVPLSTTFRASDACGFEIPDVESLREHYPLTLRHWVRRLEAKSREAVPVTDWTAFRTWRLYMSGSAHAFETGRLNLYPQETGPSLRADTSGRFLPSPCHAMKRVTDWHLREQMQLCGCPKNCCIKTKDSRFGS
jgi:cyclopropane-fatty-acyl-phospholipid synthase